MTTATRRVKKVRMTGKLRNEEQLMTVLAEQATADVLRATESVRHLLIMMGRYDLPTLQGNQLYRVLRDFNGDLFLKDWGDRFRATCYDEPDDASYLH